MKRLIIIFGIVILSIVSSHWLFGYMGSKMFDFGGYTPAKLAWTASGIAPFSNDDAIAYNIGNTEYMNQNFEAAIDKYSQVIDSQDLSLVCPALYNWAQSLVQLGDGSQSESDYQQAIARYSKALSLVSRQACVNTEEFQQPFNNLAAVIEERLKSAQEAAQTPEQQEQEEQEQEQQERKVDEELEEEIENIDEEVQQLQRSDNDDRYDETRDNDNYDVIW